MSATDLPFSIHVIPVIFLALCVISLLRPSWNSILVFRLLIYLQRWIDKQKSTKDIDFAVPPSSPSSPLAVEKDSPFSKDWWCHDDIFQLERRAIFSKTWIYAAHSSLFTKPGDYLTLNIANFSFFLILGKDHTIRAFHNVCRHRAYKVTRKERGSTTVLGCRYHGWTYDTEGRLTKAPEFDGVWEFDRSKNGLWEIRVRVSVKGLVFVNLGGGQISDDFEVGEKASAGLRGWNMAQARQVASWRYDCDLNWKIALVSISSENGIAHLFQDIPRQGLWLSELFSSNLNWNRKEHRRLDLLSAIIICPDQKFWLVIKILPQSAARTTMSYEVYAWAAPNSNAFETTKEKLRKASFENTQRLQALQKQVIEGSLNLDPEQTNEQNAVNTLLAAHRKPEISAGAEIHPAARQISLSGKGQEDVDLCKRLEKSFVREEAHQVGDGGCSKGDNLDW